MDTNWKRLWETGLIPVFEYTLSLSLGYMISLVFYVASYELSTIDQSDSTFPLFQGYLCVFFLVGMAYRKFQKQSNKLVSIGFVSLSLLLGIVFWNSGESEFLIDYIFSLEWVFVLGGLGAALLGVFFVSLADIRFLSFISGIFLFTFYSLFEPTLQVSIKPVLSIIYILLFFYFLSSLFAKTILSNRFYKIRSKIGKHPLYFPFYTTGLSLFFSYSLLHVFFQPGPKIPFILAVSFSLVVGRLLSLVAKLRKETKLIYLIGRFLTLAAFIIFLYQSQWGSFYIVIGIILGLLIGFFKPNENKKFIPLGILIEILLYFGLSYLLYHWNLSPKYKLFIAVFFAIIVSYRFLLQTHIVRFPRIVFGLSSIIIVLFFYSPPTIRSSEPYSKKENFDPIPFYLTNIDFNEEDFIYYNSVLPFPSKSFLPKRSEIIGKTVVLGLHKNPKQTISYIEHLSREKIPFLIFVSTQKANQSYHINALSLLGRKSYWGFDVYFPYYAKFELALNKKLPIDWRFKYFTEKLQGLSASEVNSLLQNTIRYSSGELRNDAFQIRDLYYESFSKYANYFHSISQYKLALDAILLARIFDFPKPDLQRIAYQSLLFTTPEPSYITILEDLASNNSYQEFAYHSLIPMYESMNEINKAIFTIDSLTNFYRSQNKMTQVDELELSRVRLLINLENWKEAEPIVIAKLRSEPDSVIWNRLKNEILEKKDSFKRLTIRPDGREARIQ